MVRLFESIDVELAELQAFRKEVPGGVFEIKNLKSDSRALSKRLGDALERNSRQAIELQELRAAMLQSSQPVSNRDELPVL